MKITLLEVAGKKDGYLNKDVMGGYGEVCKIGDSFLARVIEKQKKDNIRLPLSVYGYLAAIFYNNNHKVEYLINKVPEDSDLVIIYSSIIDYKTELAFAQEIKNKTNAKVGFIGAFATAKPEVFMEVADFVILGEPENIAQKINEKWIPKGIIKSEPVRDLDTLPYPKWDIFPIEDYSYFPVLKKKPFITILSSRGCTFNCNYCPYRTYYNKWRARSVSNVIGEIKYLTENFGIKGLLFRDPLFTVDKKRTIDIAQSIIDSGLNIEWACETHLQHLDEKLLDLLYKAGLRAINVGIESVDADVLKNASRVNAEIKQQEKMVSYCDKLGIRVSAFYVFGLPTDTEETIKRTIKYAKNLNTHTAQFFISTPFPGSEFYETVKDRLFTQDWEQFNSFTPVFKHKNLSVKQLLNLKEYAFVSYYFRLRYLWSYFRRMYIR